MKTTLSLLGGIFIGWMLHVFWDESRVTDFVPRTENKGSNAADSLQLTAPPVSPTLADKTPDAPGKKQIRMSSENGNVQEAISQCRLADSGSDACRQHVLDLVASGISNSEQIRQLETWLTESPADLQFGLLLIDALMKDRRFRRVVERLGEVRNYQVEPEAIRQVAEKVKSVIRTTERLWHENNELDGLVSLYRILIASEPQNPRWHFELSGVLKAAGDYDGALNTLSYILYDAEFGTRATSLYLDINSLVRAIDNPQVPLVKNGSQFIVEALINNTTPLRLLIDTGASITSIDKNILQKFASSSASTSRGILRTANGPVATTLVQLDSLRVGEFSIKNVEAASIEPLGSDFDGLLGMDFLGRFAFAIDQENRLLVLAAKSGR